MASPPPFASPGEWCGICIPCAEPSLECGLDFFHRVVVRPVIHASVQNPEERLRPSSATSPWWACSTARCERSAPALLPRRRLRRRGGCSGCPRRRTACRWEAGLPILGPTAAAGKPERSPCADSAAAPRPRGRHVGAATPRVGACPGYGGKSSAGIAVDRAAANCAALRDGLERTVLVKAHHSMWAGGVLQRGIGFLDGRAFSANRGSVLVQNERSACQLSPASTQKQGPSSDRCAPGLVRDAADA
jgi:hypothetical protein